MFGPPNVAATELNDYHAPNSDTAAVVTIAANAEHFWAIDSIHFGYNGLPDGAKTLIVTINSVEVHREYIPADIDTAGPHETLFPGGLYTGAKNQEAKITLAAGGTGISGAVNVTYR